MYYPNDERLYAEQGAGHHNSHVREYSMHLHLTHTWQQARLARIR